MTLKNSMLALCAALILGAAPAEGHEYPEVLFILDSSGSMQGDAGGQSKIDAAKQVMEQVVPGLASEVRVGLIAYGHRSKGDCRDIEVLMPPGSDDRGELLSRVRALKPTGKTPLAKSILTAASLLKTKDNETTIVLVSDGLDTCGGDPCRVAKQLKDSGLKFVMHVVGFDVDATAQQQLECMAGATGGDYFAATDGASLLKALESVSTEIAQKVEQAKSSPVAAQTGLGKLRISMPAVAEKALAFIRIIRLSDNKVIRQIDQPGANTVHPLKSDDYGVQLGFATPNFGEPTITDLGNFTVRKGQTRDVRLGAVAFNIPQNLLQNDFGKRIAVDEVVLADEGSNRPVVTVLSANNGYYNYYTKPVLPGFYQVRFKYRTNVEQLALVAQNVYVEPGTTTVATLNTGLQMKKAEADVEAWQLIPKGQQQAADAEDGAAPPVSAPILEARAFSPIGGGKSSLWNPYLIPPGTYDLVVFLKGSDEPLPVAEDLEIQAGQMLQFDSGL